MSSTSTRHLVCALLGPTASGKSNFALELAETLKAEIIALDSTTPYKHFNIGSSKPSPSDQKRIRHHLIDLLEPNDAFSAHDFVKQADRAVSEINSKGKLPLIVGGTYFYLRSLQNGMFAIPPIDSSVIEKIEEEYENEDSANLKMHADLTAQDPKAASQIHPNDRYRLLRALAILKSTGKQPSSLPLAPASPEAPNRLWVKYALVVPRHELTALITTRTDQMLSQGLIEETRNLVTNYPNARALSSIGYAECVRFLKNEIDQKQLRNEIIEKTRQLAKRQMTWLRSDPEIRFIDKRDKDRVALEVTNLKYAMGLKESSS